MKFLKIFKQEHNYFLTLKEKIYIYLNNRMLFLKNNDASNELLKYDGQILDKNKFKF